MEEFPFSEGDWTSVDQVTDVLLRASLANDDVLVAVYREELRCLLAELRQKYGDHPILLETEADYANDPRHRIELYRQAKGVALKNGLPIYTISISLARVLLEDLGESLLATHELLACRSETLAIGDAGERKEWDKLMEQCHNVPKGRR